MHAWLLVIEQPLLLSLMQGSVLPTEQSLLLSLM
jgi:hypothetical protein